MTIQIPLRRSRLPIFHKETEIELKRGLKGQPISCHKGCNSCCQQIVGVFYLEAVEMLRQAYKNQYNLDLMALDEQARASTKLDFDSDEDRVRWFGTPCLFLTDEGCGIYKARPTQCRVVYVRSDPVHCGDPEGEVVKYNTSWPANKAFARIRREHVELGLTPVMGPMPLMIKAILAGKTSADIAQMKGTVSLVDYNEREAAEAEQVRSGTRDSKTA